MTGCSFEKTNWRQKKKEFLEYIIFFLIICPNIKINFVNLIENMNINYIIMHKVKGIS